MSSFILYSTLSQLPLPLSLKVHFKPVFKFKKKKKKKKGIWCGLGSEAVEVDFSALVRPGSSFDHAFLGLS